MLLADENKFRCLIVDKQLKATQQYSKADKRLITLADLNSQIKSILSYDFKSNEYPKKYLISCLKKKKTIFSKHLQLLSSFERSRPKINEQIALFYLYQNKLETALNYFKRQIELENTNPHNLYRAAQIALKLNNDIDNEYTYFFLDPLIQHFNKKRFNKISPKDKEIYSWALKTKLKSEYTETSERLKSHKTLFKLNPKNQNTLIYLLKHFTQKGDYAQVISYSKKALKAKKQSMIAQIYLSLGYNQTKKYAKAIDTINNSAKTQNLSKNMKNFLLEQKIIALLGLGKIKEAKQLRKSFKVKISKIDDVFAKKYYLKALKSLNNNSLKEQTYMHLQEAIKYKESLHSLKAQLLLGRLYIDSDSTTNTLRSKIKEYYNNIKSKQFSCLETQNEYFNALVLVKYFKDAEAHSELCKKASTNNIKINCS